MYLIRIFAIVLAALASGSIASASVASVQGGDPSPTKSPQAVSASAGVTNTMCPVMEGEPVDPEIFIEHEGRRIYLCCDLCVEKFRANPARYADQLAQVMPPVELQSARVVTASSGGGDDHHQEQNSAATSESGGHSGHGHSDGHDEEAQSATTAPTDAAGQATQAAETQGHDHSAHEHDEGINPLIQFVHWLGKFHPPAVAFPIALLAAAGVAELLFMATKRPIFDHASRFCVWFGIAMTVVGGVLGWFFAGFRLTDPTWLLTTHRWLGTAATLWALLLVLPAIKTWSSTGGSQWRGLYRLALLVAILLVSANAFFGGAMIYGIGHYGWGS